MKVSKAIKICKRNQAAKDRTDHKKDIADLRSRGYTDKQYKCMVDMLEDYKLNNPDSPISIPWTTDQQYHNDPVEIHYEGIKPLNKS